MMDIQKCILACAIILVFGCSATSKQTYLHSSDIHGLDSFVITVTSTDLNVYYESGQGRPAPLAEFIGPGAILLTEAWRSGEDRAHAKEIQQKTRIAQAEAALLDEFTRELKTNSNFTIVATSAEPSSSTNDKTVSAFINLNIREVTLHRTVADEMLLEVLIHAELISKGGKVIWQRDDKTQSRRSYNLDYYKEHGAIELESLVRRIGKRLAAEIATAK